MAGARAPLCLPVHRWLNGQALVQVRLVAQPAGSLPSPDTTAYSLGHAVQRLGSRDTLQVLAPQADDECALMLCHMSAQNDSMLHSLEAG